MSERDGSDIERLRNSISRSTQNGLKMASFEFEAVLYLGFIEFRGAYFFPVEIFSSPNTVFDSVSDAESLDIKILI